MSKGNEEKKEKKEVEWKPDTTITMDIKKGDEWKPDPKMTMRLKESADREKKNKEK
jgi:hypothetical protein